MINQIEIFNQIFARRLKEERKNKGLSQHQLATKCGMGFAQVGRIERGTSKPLLSTAMVLAKALDVSLDILVPPNDYLDTALTG